MLVVTNARPTQTNGIHIDRAATCVQIAEEDAEAGIVSDSVMTSGKVDYTSWTIGLVTDSISPFWSFDLRLDTRILLFRTLLNDDRMGRRPITFRWLTKSLAIERPVGVTECIECPHRILVSMSAGRSLIET